MTEETKQEDVSFFYLKTVLLLLANASKYLRHYTLESGAEKQAKNFLSFQAKKIESVQRDMSLRVSKEMAAVMRKELTDNWETLAVQNVLGMMVQMNDEQRRKVEEFTEKLLDTCQKQK